VLSEAVDEAVAAQSELLTTGAHGPVGGQVSGKAP
jgi:hypothetical protein